MRARTRLGLVVSLIAATAIAQEKPDFSGQWQLVTPIESTTDVTHALTVRQSIEAPFTLLVVERRFAGAERTDRYRIGLIGGVVGGIDSRGRGTGPDGQIPTSAYEAVWRGGSLFLMNGSYSGPSRDSGPYTEHTEMWSLAAPDVLTISSTDRASGTEPRTSTLTYRRSTAIEASVRQAYERELGETIPRPAIYNDPRSADCKGQGHLITTAYLPRSATQSSLSSLFLTRDGTILISKRTTAARTPAGTFRVLSVLLRYPETIGDDGLTLWQAAQAQINEEHAAFARQKGYTAPIVRFDNTNVALDGAPVRDPRSIAGLQSHLDEQRVSPTGYDFVISINIDPSRSEGGFAISQSTPPFVYVGNYSRWRAPLAARELDMIARTAYHHEVAHHWGWDHGWTPTCGGTRLGFHPFIAAPVLFGWEDVDGDGVPEILDATPYGRSK